MQFNLGNGMTFDAQAATGFVTSQATHIEAAVNMMVYPDVQYPGLIPVDTSAHPFAQTVTYYSGDQYGAAKWLNGNSDDIPLAGTDRAQHKTAVHTAGIGYGFGWEEVGVAMMMGVNLQNDDAMAARRAYEEFVDGALLRGSPEKGYLGLMNYTGVTIVAAPTGAWGGGVTTEGQVLADFNALILGVANDTLYTSIADTVLLSPGKLNYLATTKLGDSGGMTLLEFIRKNNTYTAMTNRPLTIGVLRGLETAGAGSTERMIGYRRSPDVLKAHIPMPHRFLGIWQDGPLHWVNPGVFRFGGLDIRKPKEVRYMDGI